MIGVLAYRSARIATVKHDPGSYSLVVIATPVAAPVRTWLGLYRARLHRVVFLCTLGGSGADTVFEELVKLSGRAPVANCKVDARDLRDGARERLLDVFADRLERKLAQVDELEWAC
jgi:hypothetical protein